MEMGNTGVPTCGACHDARATIKVRHFFSGVPEFGSHKTSPKKTDLEGGNKNCYTHPMKKSPWPKYTRRIRTETINVAYFPTILG